MSTRTPNPALPPGVTSPRPWAEGLPILVLCATLMAWFASLPIRFADAADQAPVFAWVAAMAAWLGWQVSLARRHAPERHARWGSTLAQAVFPTMATVLLVWAWSDLGDAVVVIAHGVGVTELLAIHVLRLAAWGTVVKWRKGELPGYFFAFGSVPDFAFAVLSIGAVALVATGAVQPDGTALIGWSLLGVGAFLGAAVTMYFGVPNSPIGWRWPRAERGLEAPTLLPFRWPMNLAPAFCGPMFWLAHFLLILKVLTA